MQGQEEMRAADEDRQLVADRLRVAVDEGRLDLHEYDERLQRAYAARTYGELDALVVDLPAPAGAATSALAVPGGPAATVSASGGSARTTGSPGGSATARWLAGVWEPWLKAVPVVVAIWAVSSLLAADVLYFWPGWVAGPWGAVLLVRSVSGILSGEPARWAVERERRREKRARQRERKAARRKDRELPGGAV
ncbi:DUF1707 domain-containing protein [Micromonospora sp. WMMA1363]|uniref:DUF1707 SHOCT-like domain-containing protein n=1 Tax=Micromonospora sp. WMMA1363 TaxID=3053985 RepID=UPI00259CCED9|nr:DUF1707 domain-containing protein [Micromonospora sp. WMMA1363]MDM4720809.1 DUF1707 domain-containing protein [Micromonospora sp. WMMA1363]